MNKLGIAKEVVTLHKRVGGWMRPSTSEGRDTETASNNRCQESECGVVRRGGKCREVNRCAYAGTYGCIRTHTRVLSCTVGTVPLDGLSPFFFNTDSVADSNTVPVTFALPFAVHSIK